MVWSVDWFLKENEKVCCRTYLLARFVVYLFIDDLVLSKILLLALILILLPLSTIKILGFPLSIRLSSYYKDSLGCTLAVRPALVI